MADPTVPEKVENARLQLQHSTFDRVTGKIEKADHDTPNDRETNGIEEVEAPPPQPQQPPNDRETNGIEKVEAPPPQPQQPPNDRETNGIEKVEAPRSQPQQPPNHRETNGIEKVETPRSQPQQPPNHRETNGIEKVEAPPPQPQQPPNDGETNGIVKVETPRPQPQQPPNDRETNGIEKVETPRPQPQQPSNDPVADEIEAIERSLAQNDPVAAENNRRRIDPKLLRAIVNGDLISFKSILGTNVLTDIESTRVTNNGGNGVVGGVTYGENNALHVVAGAVIEKTSRTSLRQQIFLIISLVFVLLFGIGLIPIFLMGCYIMINRVIIFVSGHFPWIPQKIYEKAKRTRWLKWVLSFYKRRMYMEIADIIYLPYRTLLYAPNCAEETPLHCAANAGNLHMVSLLVKFARTEGPQKLEQLLRARNKVGETALHEAARSGYSDVVEELLRTDENLASLVDKNGISPLYWAVTAGCLDVVHMLTALNRLTSYTGPDGQTALHAAVMIQKETITRAILKWNPSLAVETDKAGNTPLHYAALIGNTSAVIELLLKDTGSAYKANLSGSFPVHLAAEAGKIKVIKELLSMCPDVGELLDKGKKNFLHVAVEKKRIEVIKLINQVRINAKVINAKDKDGNTPMHLAVLSSDSDIFYRLFRNKRVNLNIRNEVGLTPLDISASLQDHKLKYLLIPQNVIYRALLDSGAFQNPCQPDLSKKKGNLVKGRADCPNRTEGKEMCNDVEDDIEKELTDCENKSKSLTTGSVLIASATFVAIFTVSKLYDDARGHDTSSPTYLGMKNVFTAFVVADMVAFICALVSTIWLLYASLSNFLPKYRKIYFRMCTPLLYVALHLFILAFGLGSYIAIAPLNDLLAVIVFPISGFFFLFTILIKPRFFFPESTLLWLVKLSRKIT